MPHDPSKPRGGAREKRRLEAVRRKLEEGTLTLEQLAERPSRSLSCYQFERAEGQAPEASGRERSRSAAGSGPRPAAESVRASPPAPVQSRPRPSAGSVLAPAVQRACAEEWPRYWYAVANLAAAAIAYVYIYVHIISFVASYIYIYQIYICIYTYVYMYVV